MKISKEEKQKQVTEKKKVEIYISNIKQILVSKIYFKLKKKVESPFRFTILHKILINQF